MMRKIILLILNRSSTRLFIILNSIFYRLAALSRGSWISLGASLKIFRGGRFYIGRGVRISTNAVVSVVEGAVLSIGDKSWVGPGCIIYCEESVHIGRSVRIAHYTSILDHDYEIHQGGSLFDKPRVASPITIDSNVWIGAYCIIMKGATIGADSVIAAQTILRSADIPAQSLIFNKGKSDLAIRNLGTR